MKKVCMVVYAYYPEDPRVRKEAEALARNGYSVDVICLKHESEKRTDVQNEVNIFRLSLQSARKGGKFRYAYQYIMFFILATCKVTSLNFKYKYRVVHTHTVPDFIIFTAIVPKHSGSKLILDMHEGMPEIYLSKLNATKDGFFYRLFVLMERISSRYAYKIITVSDYIKKVFVERGMDPEKITVVYNVPDTDTISKPVETKEKSIVFSGNLNDYNDFDTVLLAIEKLPNVKLHIYGDGIMTSHIKEKLIELGLQQRVFLHGHASPIELNNSLPGFSAGIILFSDIPITRIAIGNKVFEYTAAGLPVISPRLPSLMSLFDESCMYYYDAGDLKSLLDRIKLTLENKSENVMRVKKCQEIIKSNGLTWNVMQQRLLAIYRELTEN